MTKKEQVEKFEQIAKNLRQHANRLDIIAKNISNGNIDYWTTKDICSALGYDIIEEVLKVREFGNQSIEEN